MCGIIGSVNIEWQGNPLEAISKRGPDSSAELTYNNVYLGHTRLSIQDTSSLGNQPMVSDDGIWTMVFNGEIYNHWELRDELIKDFDIQFKSSSDTETLLLGWMHYGEKFLNKLNGIFALAIFNNETKQLFLVRDPYGVKPFYIYNNGNSIAFSSELKAFLNVKDFDTKLNIKGIGNYLTFLWSPGEDTMYQKVKKLLPGHLMSIDTKQGIVLENKQYHNESDTKAAHSEEEWLDILDKALNKAVERQMLSDVPIGFFLSGGLDSSLLVAIARKITAADKEIDCFTINTVTSKGKEGFEDDLPFARKVASHLGVNLHEVKIGFDEVKKFDELIYSLDEPQADLAPHNVRLIAKLAREKNIKVLIGGAAGDDLFSGYRRHGALKLEQILEKVPKFILGLGKAIFSLLPSKKPFFRRLKKLSRDWGKPLDERFLGYFNWLPNNDMLNSLFSNAFKNQVSTSNSYAYGYSILESVKDKTLLDRMLILEEKTFLIDHNLNYTDKLSMLEGIEARVPFLDFELVKLAHQIPDSLKMKNGETKYILKKVAERYLPKEIIYRSKTGFGSPVRDMIDNEFQPLIKQDLSKENIEKQGIFNYETINEIVKSHTSGKEDFGYTILSLLAIQSWLKQFKWTL